MMRIEPFPADWKDAWHTRFATLRMQYPQARLYALVEGVLNEECHPLLERLNVLPFFPLYANTPSADKETLGISPLLIEYVEAERLAWESVLGKLNGLPALSILVTAEPLDTVVQRLTPWCVVEADGYTLALSFADTRILPRLIECLSHQQLAQLCGPVSHWLYLGRDAVWHALAVPGKNNCESPATDTVQLTKEQCTYLMAAAEPDNVLHQLQISAPEALAPFGAARAHDIARYWLDCADHAQITGAPERIDLCRFGFNHPELMQSDAVESWRSKASAAYTYANLLTHLLKGARG